MALRKIADIKLGEWEYQLAKNGTYCLTYRKGVDVYDNPYYEKVEPKNLGPVTVADLIDLVGQQTEELAKLRVAVGRTEE